MAAGNIDDAPTAKEAAHTARRFPGLEQLLARQAPGMTERTSQPVKERVVRKPAKVVLCEPAF
jgi:hypothetical protein